MVQQGSASIRQLSASGRTQLRAPIPSRARAGFERAVRPVRRAHLGVNLAPEDQSAISGHQAGDTAGTPIGIPPSRPSLATPIALIMRAPTLIRTARLGAGKLLIKKFSRAATLPPVPTEKDVPLREADIQMKEVVEWGKLVDEYSKLSNTSKPDAARVLAAYRTTKSIAGFEPYIKKVIADAVGDNLQYLSLIHI